MRDDLFVGRRRELESYFEGLGKSLALRNAPRLIRVTGDAGVGKTALLRRIAADSEQGGAHVLYAFPPDFAKLETHEEWLAALNRSLASPRKQLHTLASEYRREQVEPSGTGKDPPEAKALPPVEKAPETDEEPAATEDEEQAGGENQSQSARNWLQGLISCLAAAQQHSRQRIVFVFDGWDQYKPSLRSWIAGALWNEALAQEGEIEVRFLISGRTFPQGESFHVWWPGAEENMMEIALQPLIEAEARELLIACKAPADKHQEWIAKAKGSPARLKELIQKAAGEIQKAGNGDFARQLLQGKERPQRNWMLRAAHLEVFDAESLGIFGGLDKADAVFAWLKGRIELKLHAQGNGYRVSEESAKALRDWHEEENPEEFRQFQFVVQAYRSVCEIAPEPRDRQILLLLSHFNYFNEGILAQLLPADAETLKHFVETRPDYFIHTDDNSRLAENYRECLCRYRELAPSANVEELSKKIAGAWQHRRNELVDRAAKVEDDLKKQEKELEAVNSNLSKMRQEDRKMRIGAVAPSSEQAPSGGVAQRVRTSVPRGRGAILAGVAVEVIGIFLLYMGILFADQLSIAYCSMGLLLVLGGLFWPYKRVVLQSAPSTAGGVPVSQEPMAAPRVAASNDPNARLMAMKLENLENKRKILSEKAARNRRELGRLDNLLTESYC